MRPFIRLFTCSAMCVLASSDTPAIAQIEFAKSTIRIKTPDETPTTRQAVTRLKTRPTPTAAPLPAPELGTQASEYPVRQANYDEPPALPSTMQSQTPGRAPTMVNVYSARSAQTALNKIPRPVPVQSTPQLPKQARGKPFQEVQRDQPTISPYLNMYRTDTNPNSLPNYLAYVRPQLEQQAANRQQAAELQKLRRQVQTLSGDGAPNSANMSAHAKYMDTAQFYNGLRR